MKESAAMPMKTIGSPTASVELTKSQRPMTAMKAK